VNIICVIGQTGFLEGVGQSGGHVIYGTVAIQGSLDLLGFNTVIPRYLQPILTRHFVADIEVLQIAR
jgi:hypothetical protein